MVCVSACCTVTAICLASVRIPPFWPSYILGKIKLQSAGLDSVPDLHGVMVDENLVDETREFHPPDSVQYLTLSDNAGQLDNDRRMAIAQQHQKR